MSTALSLTHLVRPAGVGSSKPPLLLLLHGVGSNEHDLFALAPHLDERFVIVSPRAPNLRSTGGYAWFDVQFTSNGPLINPQQAEESRQLLLHFISEAAAAYAADPERVYLMGFSQGAIMSASVALTAPEAVAGAVLMSGRILPEIHPLIAEPQRLRGLPILLVHGIYDNVLPIHHGRSSRELLSTLPVSLDYREYPMGHEVRAESIADIQGWLAVHANLTSTTP